MTQSRKRPILLLLPVFIVVFGVIFLTREGEPPAERTSVPPQTVTDSVLSADSVMIRYDVHGAGERALVFIHCWCCDRTYWNAQVDEFSKDYRVVSLDLAGHGQSGMNRDAWTMAAYGDDVAAVVNKLDLSEVILLGHSMGGTVMIEAARLLGPRIVALVGVDNLQNLERKISEEQIAQYLSHFASDFSTATYEFVRGMFPPTADSALANAISKEMASAPEDVALGSFNHLFRYDYSAALSEVRLPIRCINSDEHPTDVEANNRVAESFGVKIMPGSGHFPHIVDPATFNQLLHQTIEEFWPAETNP